MLSEHCQKNDTVPPRSTIDSLLARLRGLRPARPFRLMEVCGGQTHSILRHGLDLLLEEHANIQLLHGPGCPVCVTPAAYLDRAIAIARLPGTLLCTFGDLLRVPSGASGDLFAARAAGTRVQTCLSPLDALDLAGRNPSLRVVWLAIGFETTAPAHALALRLARERRLANFCVLPSLFLLPPVLRAICADPDTAPDAFLAAGHVCTVTGPAPYEALAAELRRPIAITGFTPEEILLGACHALRLHAAGTPACFNAYPSAVHPGGNPAARALMRETFVPCDQVWRGLGPLPRSGLALSPDYASFDANALLPPSTLPTPAAAGGAGADDAPACPASKILRGLLAPPDCPHFGGACTPDTPLGAPMVSPEGPCSAFYLHRPRVTSSARPPAPPRISRRPPAS